MSLSPALAHVSVDDLAGAVTHLDILEGYRRDRVVPGMADATTAAELGPCARLHRMIKRVLEQRSW
jgi:hypothetical protein